MSKAEKPFAYESTEEWIPVEKIVEHEHNRTTFDEEKLKELASSIAAHGILTPLLLRTTEEGYELLAGHRRLRAAKSLGHKTVPCRVFSVDEIAAFEILTIENDQREDLHPLDRARAYRRLMTLAEYDVNTLAVKLGKSKEFVYNQLKLLDGLSTEVQDWWLEEAPEALTASHAVLLARLPEEKQVLAAEVASQTSVRGFQDWLDQQELRPKAEEKKPEPAPTPQPDPQPALVSLQQVALLRLLSALAERGMVHGLTEQEVSHAGPRKLCEIGERAAQAILEYRKPPKAKKTAGEQLQEDLDNYDGLWLRELQGRFPEADIETGGPFDMGDLEPKTYFSWTPSGPVHLCERIEGDLITYISGDTFQPLQINRDSSHKWWLREEVMPEPSAGSEPASEPSTQPAEEAPPESPQETGEPPAEEPKVETSAKATIPNELLIEDQKVTWVHLPKYSGNPIAGTSDYLKVAIGEHGGHIFYPKTALIDEHGLAAVVERFALSFLEHLAQGAAAFDAWQHAAHAFEEVTA